MSKHLTLALVAITLFVGTLRAQSLAEVARKEEERRKASPPPTKVYTNKDLVEIPGDSVPPAPAQTSDSTRNSDKSSSDSAKADDKVDDNPKKEQAYWSKRLKALQDKLDRDSRSFSSALQSQINAPGQRDFVNRDDPAQRAVIEQKRVKALAELNQLKKDVLADQKAITDDLHEEAHAGRAFPLVGCGEYAVAPRRRSTDSDRRGQGFSSDHVASRCRGAGA